MILRDVLDAVSGRVSYLRATTATEGDHWYSCEQLVTDRDVLVDVVEGTMAGFGTDDPAVAASLFVQAYAFRVAGVALAAYTLDLPVPDVSPAATTVRIDKPRPTQVAHLQPGVRAMDAEQLSELLVTGHLDPFVAAVHDAFRVGERLLYGNVAASCAVAFRAVHDDDPDQRRVRERGEAFMAATPSFQGLGGFTTVAHGARVGWYWDRTSCCLWFRTTGDRYCDNCSLLDVEELSQQRVRELAEADS